MIRFAILGCGYIANRVAKGIEYANNATLYAVASRDEKKAREYKEKYKAEIYYTNYEELCKDEKVDCIYICTPNHLHFEQIQLCFKHHKNVVCEKPMVKDSKQVKELFTMAKESNCFLMEAHKTCFTPLNKLIKQRVQSGEFGKIISIQADYSYDCDGFYAKDSWAMNPLYGGSSYDVGVYPACFCNFMMNSDIKNVNAYPIRKDGLEADFGMLSLIQYENGGIGQANSSWMHFTKDKGKAFILCEKGTIEIPAFWKSNKAIIYKDKKEEKIEVEMKSDFTGEIEEAATCIEKGFLESDIMGCKESCEIMKVIECANSYRMK